MIKIKTIQFKRGNKERLEDVLVGIRKPLQGEPVYELDTNKIKIGDGKKDYKDLPYLGGEGGGATLSSVELDYENAKIIFTFDDPKVSPIVCDISAIKTDIETKQDILISGENIKTINGESILGSGDIEIISPWEPGLGENSAQTRGTGCVAEGKYSVAEGWTSKTLKKGDDPLSGQAAHAEGAETNASGFAAHSEGGRTNAEGDHSHAEGYETTALGGDSHTEGNHTIANNFAEHAEGAFNVSHMNSDNYGDPLNTQHSIGIGTAEVDPETGKFIGAKNAVEVMQNGDQYIIGVGGYDGKTLDNAKTVQEVINNKQDKITDENPIEASKVKLEDNRTVEAAITDIEENVSTLSSDVEELKEKTTTIEQDIEDIKENKQDKLTAGSNITIENNVISATVPETKLVYNSIFDFPSVGNEDTLYILRNGAVYIWKDLHYQLKIVDNAQFYAIIEDGEITVRAERQINAGGANADYNIENFKI